MATVCGASLALYDAGVTHNTACHCYTCIRESEMCTYMYVCCIQTYCVLMCSVLVCRCPAEQASGWSGVWTGNKTRLRHWRYTGLHNTH